VSKSSSSGETPRRMAVSRRRRPVTLLFRHYLQGSELSMKRLIDGGLARLIAGRVAATALSRNSQAVQRGEMGPTKLVIRPRLAEHDN
jgi:hypothetical protein